MFFNFVFMFSLNYIPRRPKRNSKIHIKSPADITSTGVIFILGKGVSDILASGVNSTWSKGSSEPGFSTIFDEIIPDIRIIIGEHCTISIEDYMSVQKDENGAILKTKVKNKITMQTYEEHGHISDTFRYVVADLVREKFLLFSNRRKRNLYARDGIVHFYNPDTECKYSREIVYAMPNVNGKFALVHGKLCGEKWHIVNLMLRETSSTDEIAEILVNAGSQQTVIECAQAYFRFVRDLRKEIPNVRVMNEVVDVDQRIAATSDFVKNHLLFNDSKLAEDVEYSQFMTNLFDYNRATGESIEASAVLSGFIQFVVKFSFDSDSEANADNIAS